MFVVMTLVVSIVVLPLTLLNDAPAKESDGSAADFWVDVGLAFLWCCGLSAWCLVAASRRSVDVWSLLTALPFAAVLLVDPRLLWWDDVYGRVAAVLWIAIVILGMCWRRVGDRTALSAAIRPAPATEQSPVSASDQ